MALTRTSLSAAASATTHTLSITSTSSGFPAVGTYAQPPQLMQVDSEYMLIQLVPVANTVKVMQRGCNGSKVTAHDILAPVVTSSVIADFAEVAQGEVVTRPPDVWLNATLGQDGAITIPNKNSNILITKASACLFTLAAPSKDQDGLTLRISSATAQAHVLTATTLLENGLSGSPFTTATWAAFIGGTLTLVAFNGVWNLAGAGNGVTLS